MISVEQLTAPLAGADPCGEDLSLGTRLIELDALVLGKQETQFNEAEDPDWREVEKIALKLFEVSRDLRVSLALTLAELKMKGMPGFRSGIALIRALLEKYWEHLHPKLDPEDGNDPLQRMNILSVLSAPLGSAGDPMRFIERLRDVELTASPQMGKLTFGRIHDSRTAVDDPAKRLGPAQIEAALRDTPAELRETLFTSTSQILEDLRGIETSLQSHISAVQSANFSDLKSTLNAILEIIRPYVANSAPSPTASDGTAQAASAAGGPSSAAGSQAGALSGQVSNRQDVLRSLELIRDYYKKHEPASPIPLLVRRVERLVPMTFLEIMNELAPDGVSQVNTIVGTQE